MTKGTKFSCSLDQLGMGSVKINDVEVGNITSDVRVDAVAGERSRVTVELRPEENIELEFPAQVIVNITAYDGEIIKTPLENGQVSYKVIRQAPMFPPGT